jgi:hypothetical protein
MAFENSCGYMMAYMHSSPQYERFYNASQQIYAAY